MKNKRSLSLVFQGDGPVSSPFTVVGIYIDLDGKVDPLHINELRHANTDSYPEGEKKWNDYIDRLLDFPKDKRGALKVMWEKPYIEDILRDIDEARVRLGIWYSGSRFINPDTRKIYKSRQRLWNETVMTFSILDGATEYYFDGLYTHATKYSPALIFKDVYAATTHLQMQSCVAYRSPEYTQKNIVLGNTLRGAVPGSTSNCEEFTIINKP